MSDTATIADTALNVTGMDCASCVAHVEKALKSVDGVVEAQVNLARGRATVKFDPGATNPQSLAAAVSQSGYPTQPELATAGHAAEQERLTRQTREAVAWFRRAMVGVILWLPLETTHWLREFFSTGHHAMFPAQQDWMTYVALVTSTIAIVYVGGKFYRSAFSALRRGTTNMDVLIAMGASVAYFYSLALLLGGFAGLWPAPMTGRLFFMEATGLLALISLGHWLEARARQSAGSAIRDLLDLTPATATRLAKAPAPQRTSTNSVKPGESGGEGNGGLVQFGFGAKKTPPISPAIGRSAALDRSSSSLVQVEQSGDRPHLTSPGGRGTGGNPESGGLAAESSENFAPEERGAGDGSESGGPAAESSDNFAPEEGGTGGGSESGGLAAASSDNFTPKGGETGGGSELRRRAAASSDNLSLPPGESGSEGDRKAALIGERPFAAFVQAPSLQAESLSPHPSSLSAAESEAEIVPVSELQVGDVILVRPGDRVPADGSIVDGTSSLDESMITGEPLPVSRTVGEPVIGGTVNRDGALQVRVSQVGSETALSQIVRLVETAQSSKPPVQKLADQISAVFVPVVLVIALITGIGWYAYGVHTGMAREAMWSELANAVCSVLIIACPCALGLAIPAALMVGTGRGAKRGILLRDIDALQKAETIDTIVLDKTGTVTLGRPRVDRVQPAEGTSEEQLLRLAAGVEKFSEHPLAKAIVDFATSRGVALPNPERFNADPGYGAIANVDGRTLLVGNARLIEKHGGQANLPEHGATEDGRRWNQTLVHIAEMRGEAVVPLGVISLVDTIKPDSAAAVKSLQARGLRTVLLTGDHAAAAEAIAKEVGIDQIHAGVLPSGKADVIRRLQEQGRKVAMVGDGINDAPALAQAQLGIAIGSGSDIAKETGDIVLVSGSLHGIGTAIGLSRATMRVIRQNLFFAFLYNVLAIPLAATGHLSPLLAAAAMALSDVTVLGNALRLRRTKID